MANIKYSGSTEKLKTKAYPKRLQIGRWSVLEKRPYLVNWSIACLDKMQEGLGIGNLSTLNKALVGKWS